MNRSRPGKTRIAVFDVDETLIAGTSAEVQLIHFLRDRKIITWATLARSLGRPLKTLICSGWEAAVHWKSYYLKGIPVRTVYDLVPEFLEERIYPNVFRPLAETIPVLKRAGYTVYLLTGTLDFLLPPLMAHFDADDGTGSHAGVAGGAFTGRILGTHPYYRGKVTVLRRMLGDIDVDFVNSFAFGDSVADKPLLSLFGHPYTVHPSRLLRKYAEKCGWGILDHSFDPGRDLIIP
ncbi:HAD-IB family hydrolase [bacterium]|nr:HAD-IB family hydrolase [bacterium]